jgi:RNA polymerase sigma factor (TIGR02999 family)
LRLVAGDAQQRWDNRRHFFSVAADAMRRILVENARKKKRLKHGGGIVREALNDGHTASGAAAEDIVALNEALDALTAVDPEAAEVVKLRYFAGFEINEVAEILQVNRNAVNENWNYARSWLYRQLNK